MAQEPARAAGIHADSGPAGGGLAAAAVAAAEKRSVEDMSGMGRVGSLKDAPDPAEVAKTPAAEVLWDMSALPDTDALLQVTPRPRPNPTKRGVPR